MTSEREESFWEPEAPDNLEGMTPDQAKKYLELKELCRQAGIEGMKEVERERADLQRRGLIDTEGNLIKSNYV